MSIKSLLTVTAALELGAAAALLIAPSSAAELLLGAGLASPEAIMVGRVAGAALLSIGLSCWLTRGSGNAQTGLVGGVLAYNVAIPALLAYAALGENIGGILLWPACVLHAALSVWCALCLLRARNRRDQGAR